MSLREVLIDELKDLYSAENQLVKQLPKTARGTYDAALKQIFVNHLEETKGQVERLRQIFEKLSKKPTGKHCKGMEGAIDEVKEALDEDEEGSLMDAGIIGGAVRVEHYEIAGYTAAIAMARQIGENEVVALLTQTLNEELLAAKMVMGAAKTILKQAFMDEQDEKNPPEKKPKNSKEKTSEKQSQKDERDAAAGMNQSAEESVEAEPRSKKTGKKKK